MVSTEKDNSVSIAMEMEKLHVHHDKSAVKKLGGLVRRTYNRNKKFIGGMILASSILFVSPQSLAKQQPAQASLQLSRTGHHQNTDNSKSSKKGKRRQEYDFMMGETLRHDSKVIERVVTAVPQSGNDGGIAMMVNGLTNKHWWYQFPIEYEWKGAGEGPGSLYFAYEIWSAKRPLYKLWKGWVPRCDQSITNVDITAPDVPEKSKVKNSSGNVVLYEHSKFITINPWDNVDLKEYINGNMLILYGKDLKNHNWVELGFRAHGDRFIGTKGKHITDMGGCSTGVLTEEKVYGNAIPTEKSIKYKTVSDSNASPIVWYSFQSENPNIPYAEYTKGKQLKTLSSKLERINLRLGQMEVSSNIFITSSESMQLTKPKEDFIHKFDHAIKVLVSPFY